MIPTSDSYGAAIFFVVFEIIPTPVLLTAYVESRDHKENPENTLFINSRASDFP